MRGIVTKRSSIIVVSITLIVAVGLILSGCGSSGSSKTTVKSQLPPDTASMADTLPKVDLYEAENKPQPVYGWVIRDLINVRGQPSTSSEIVAQLKRGDRVELVSQEGNWWGVRLTDGAPAYVYAPLLSEERYVEPLERFKLEARRTNPDLAGIDDALTLPEAPMTLTGSVTQLWISSTPERQRQIAEGALRFWAQCLAKCGYETQTAKLLLNTIDGQAVARAVFSRGQVDVTLY